MGITSQRSNFHHHLTALLRWFMSQPPPTYIQGLFASSDCMVDTRTWHQLLRDDASSCKLTCLEFYKTRVAKLHEFLVLYFSHPTHIGARAVVVVDRTLKDRSQSSAVVSPSIPPQKATDAHDRVYVMAQGENLDTYLSRTYGKYDKLCTLRYPSAESDPPSAVRVSTLLLVATNHQPNYNLYEYNCYWYADIIFEACKDLFPMCQEECHKHGDRGRSRLNIPMLAKHSLRDICDEYHHEWNKVMQRRKTNQEIIAQQELEQRFEAAQQELQRRLEASQQESQQRLEESQRKLEALERRHEAEQQELKQKLEEALQQREEAERRCLQAARQPLRHLGHPAI